MSKLYLCLSVLYIYAAIANCQSFKALLRAVSPVLGEVVCDSNPNTALNSFPTADGTCNNLHADRTILYGANGETLPRESDVNYQDGIQKPVDRVSPRILSNEFSSQEQSIPNSFHGSHLIPFFGQFIDHDLDLVLEKHGDRLDIPVESGDCLSENHCPSFLEFVRSQPGNEGCNCPRQFRTVLTSYLDLSSIYGSTKERESKLRSGVGGEMKVRKVKGQIFLPLNKDVKTEMDRDNEHALAGGDRRTNEHLGLIALTTLFVREHNRLAKKYRSKNPKASDEQIYEEARIRNIAQYQSIIYTEWLPAILGKSAMNEFIGSYKGYSKSSRPDVSLEFATAVFRWGHSAIPEKLHFVNTKGVEIRNVDLTTTFFTPQTFEEEKGLLDATLIGLTTQPHEEIDAKVVNPLRQGLFKNSGNPRDLVSLNLQRGRDHGLGSLSSLRKSLGISEVIVGLDPVSTFYGLTSNLRISQKLAKYFAGIDDCDLWLCGLLEKDYKDSQLGLTFTKAMAMQFKLLRDGDRFHYKNMPDLEKELNLPARISEIFENNIKGFKAKSDLFHIKY